MLEYIRLAWTWLGAENAALPYVLLTLLALFAMDLWKAASPKSWTWFVSRTPWAREITQAQELAHNILLALPSVIVAGLASAIMSGGDVTSTILGLIAGAFAPLMHHVRKALKKPPSGGDGNPVGVVDVPTAQERKPPGPPTAAFRGVLHPALWLGAIALFGLQACSPAQWQQQAEFADRVAVVSNTTVLPMLQQAYDTGGMAVIALQPDRESAAAAIAEYRRRWAPVWAGYDALKAAHDAWQDTISAKGDPMPSAVAARKAFCELRVAALEVSLKLPDFPVLRCQ